MTHYTIIRRQPLNQLVFNDYPPVLQRVLARRQLNHPQELHCELEGLLPPDLLSNIDVAAKRIVEALQQQQKILIVGDFDADGATSIALCIKVLRALGAQFVNYLVPNRFEDGYGLSRHLLSKLSEIPHLIMTVDNGIASIDGILYANEQGIDVIVTDHHLPSEQLPPAYAIVNPNLQGDAFPSKVLAGVGVAFYVLLRVRQLLRAMGWAFDVNLAHYLDLVAFGTVADVVPLDHNNRILVEQGLKRIRKGRVNAGIYALCQLTHCDIDALTTTDIGFRLAPKLNAAGRLDDMQIGIECLLAEDSVQALALATQLVELNQERQQIEASMLIDAEKRVEETLDRNHLPLGVCVFDESFHAGVTGIVASRLKERLFRPVIVFAPDDDDWLKGSARSIRQIHMRDTLALIAQRYPNLIGQFGGHAMAAGLRLHKNAFTQFQRAFIEVVSEQISDSQLENIIYSDGELSESEYTLSTVQLLNEACPWGQEFPSPVFDDQFTVISHNILKNQHIKFQLAHRSGQVFSAMAFFQAKYFEPTIQKLHCAFTLQRNEWQGEVKLQLQVLGFNALG